MNSNLRFSSTIIYSLVVLMITIYLFISKSLNINSGLDTIYDEGYLLLKLWEARNEVGNHGVSQWAILVSKTFGYQLSSNLIFLKIINIFFQILSVIFLIYAVCKCTLKKDYKSSMSIGFFHISFISLLLYPTLGSLFLYYNPIQQILFNLIVGSILFYQSANDIRKNIFLFLCGLFSFLSFLVIPPSGIVVAFLLIAFVFAANDFKIKKTFISSIYYILGIFILAVAYHVFINNLIHVYNDMQVVASSISKTNRGYDIFTFLIKYLVYFKDILLSIIPLVVVSLISVYVHRFNKLFSYIVFISLLILTVNFWPWNKAMYSTMIFFPAFVSIILYFFSSSKNKTSIFLMIFLFIFPFVALLGTNVYYGGKIVWFFITWGIIPLLILSNDIKFPLFEKYRTFFIFSISIIYLLTPIKSAFTTNTNEYYFKKYKNISEIKITKSQLDYFNRVDSILNIYNFVENKHYMFSTQLDHMTIYAFNAKPNSTYFQPMDFLVDNNSDKLKRPEFMFLTKFDLDIAEEKLRDTDWGFPDAYDKYYVGTPETYQTGYSTERWLYCLKDLKQIE